SPLRRLEHGDSRFTGKPCGMPRIIPLKPRRHKSHLFYVPGNLILLMPNRPVLARLALLLIVLMLLFTPGSAAGTGPSEREFPEMIPDDPIPEYIWNIPLKLVLLDFVFMNAPLLLLPVQFLISVFAWLCLGHRRISR